MNGRFFDGKSGSAISIIILLVGMTVSVYIVYITKLEWLHFILPVVYVGITVVIDRVLGKGTFSADEKSVTFRCTFKKYEYLYKNIISVKSKIIFTDNVRSGKIPHMEIALSMKSGKIVRFYDSNIPRDILTTEESIKEIRENHQFTELAEFIKSNQKGNI